MQKNKLFMLVFIIIVFSLGILFGVYIIAGRYEICCVGEQVNAHVFRMNRITGKVEFALIVANRSSGWIMVKNSDISHEQRN